MHQQHNQMVNMYSIYLTIIYKCITLYWVPSTVQKNPTGEFECRALLRWWREISGNFFRSYHIRFATLQSTAADVVIFLHVTSSNALNAHFSLKSSLFLSLFLIHTQRFSLPFAIQSIDDSESFNSLWPAHSKYCQFRLKLLCFSMISTICWAQNMSLPRSAWTNFSFVFEDKYRSNVLICAKPPFMIYYNTFYIVQAYYLYEFSKIQIHRYCHYTLSLESTQTPHLYLSYHEQSIRIYQIHQYITKRSFLICPTKSPAVHLGLCSLIEFIIINHIYIYYIWPTNVQLTSTIFIVWIHKYPYSSILYIHKYFSIFTSVCFPTNLSFFAYTNKVRISTIFEISISANWFECIKKYHLFHFI